MRYISILEFLPPSILSAGRDPSRRLNHFHVAILIRRGKVLAVATNREGSRSFGCGFSDHSLHAERAVIKKVGDYSKLRGAVMVVVRLTSVKHKPHLANSAPCQDCQKTLRKCMREYGLKAVYYS